MIKKYNESQNEENVFNLLFLKYSPFWPLFILLLLLGLIGSTVYLKFVTPVYEASGSIMIKDENKGVNESAVLESMNMFNSKKIVENEIEVIQSRTLRNQVVKALDLYAPVYEGAGMKTRDAYSTSPVKLKVQNPESIAVSRESNNKISFSYNSNDQTVILDKIAYPINEWVKTKYGVLMFYPNENQQDVVVKPLYFSLINPKILEKKIARNLDVMSASKLSTVINLRYQDPVPQRAEDILNGLINKYNDLALQDMKFLAANTLTFIDERMAKVESELHAVENQIQTFKTEQGVVDLSEQGKIYLKNVGDNDKRLADISIQLAVLDKVEKYVVSKENSAGIVPSTLGINDEILTELLRKLYDLEIEYERLKKTVGENNPILSSLIKEINQVRPSILENVKSQKANLQASLQNLDRTNDKFNTTLQSIPLKEQQLLEVSRKKAVINELYGFLLKKKEETALSFAPSSSESKVIDFAESSIIPVSPKPILIYFLGGIIAVFSGIIFVVFKQGFRPKLRFLEEVERSTGIPVESLTEAKKSSNLTGNQGRLEDRFRLLCISLGLFKESSNSKKILITSSIVGEGKDFISINIARNLALTDKKVVLLDFDLRNASISNSLGFQQRSGLSEFLSNEMELDKIILKTEGDDLFFIPAGIALKNAANLLASKKVSELFKFLDKNYDYIFINTPAIEVFPDSYLLSEQCDLALYIITKDITPKGLIKNIKRNTKALGNTVIVFNALKINKYLYKKREERSVSTFLSRNRFVLFKRLRTSS